MLRGDAKLALFLLYKKLGLNFDPMASRRIMVLAALGLVVSAYFIFLKDRDDFLYLFAVSLIIGMLAYVFQYQLDQMMTRGVPQAIPAAMHGMLLNTAPHFSSMHPQQRLMMEDRMKRWILKKEFINQNEQDAPEDVKFILAYYAVLLTMHQEDYLYNGIDRIVFYHHPFLTPQNPDEVRILELESTDGTLILSVPHLLKGHLEKGYYNIALHSIAEAYAEKYIHQRIEWPDDIWQQLEEISSISKEKLEDYLGLQLTDPWPVAVHHQIMYKGSYVPEVLKMLPQFGTVEVV